MNKNVASTIPVVQPNLIKDGLYYLHPAVAVDEVAIAKARGQLSGVITAVMALQGCTFEDAVAFIVPYLPSKIVWACIPKPWHEEFLKQGATMSAEHVAMATSRMRYARMVGL